MRVPLRDRGLRLLLLLLFVLRWFGGGWQCVPLFVFAELICSLAYSRGCSSWWQLLLLYAAQTLGSAFQIAGVARHPDLDASWLAIMLLVEAVIQAAVLSSYAADRLAMRLRDGPSHCVFPCTFTGVQVLLVYVSPGGSWGVYGYCPAHTYASALALLSLCGLSTLQFLLAVFASAVECVLFERLPQGGWRRRVEPRDDGADADDANRSAQDTALWQEPERPEPAPPPPPPVVTARATALLLLLCAMSAFGVLYSRAPSTFGASDGRPSVVFSCIAAARGTLLPCKTLVDMTGREARGGAEWVVWSERPCVMQKGDETSLWKLARNATTDTRTYTVMAYDLASSSGSESEVALLDATGKISLHTRREHRSPFGKGPGSSSSDDHNLQTQEYGQVAVMMGFDLAFPPFVRDVARGAALVLAPAEDYGPLYAMQWNQGALRAAEQGTTVVQCSSVNGLTIVDAFGHTLHTAPFPHNQSAAVLRATVPYHKDGVSTLYSVWRDAFGWLCLAVSVVTLITGRLPGGLAAVFDDAADAASVRLPRLAAQLSRVAQWLRDRAAAGAQANPPPQPPQPPQSQQQSRDPSASGGAPSRQSWSAFDGYRMQPHLQYYRTGSGAPLPAAAAAALPVAVRPQQLPQDDGRGY